MSRENLADLQSFVTVARERSFTRAAAQLGLSRSALSHAMSSLEHRLGIQLLTRTTRSVATTEAGDRLLASVEPRLAEISASLLALTEFRDRPAGLVRISATDFAISVVLWPRLLPLMRANPDIRIELHTDYGLTDIVAERFDAGVRVEHRIARDMTTVLIAPDQQMAIVASPDYLARHPAPREPTELHRHRCIGLRLPTHGGLATWELERDGQPLSLRVDGQAIFNSMVPVLQAAVDGMGLAYVSRAQAQAHLDAGDLLPVLVDWWPRFAGYLYYPAHRQASPAFDAVVEALRHRHPAQTSPAGTAAPSGH